MEYYLFDKPNYGIIAGIIIETAMFIVWAISQRQYRHLYLLAGPAIIGLAFLMDALVETNREQVESTTRAIVQAAEEENAQAIIDMLSDHFIFYLKYDKQKFSAELNARMNKPLIESNLITALRVTKATNKSGQAECAIFTTFPAGSNYSMYGTGKTKWQFDYIRNKDGRYRLSGLTMLSLNNGAPVNPMNH